MTDHDPRGGRLNDGLGGITKDRIAKARQQQMAVSRALFATLEPSLPAHIEDARRHVVTEALWTAANEAERHLRAAHARLDLNDWWDIDGMVGQAHYVGAVVKTVEGRGYQMAWISWGEWSHGVTVPEELVGPLRAYIDAFATYRNG